MVSKTTKFTIVIFGSFVFLLVLANYFHAISIDVNGLLNSVLESLVAGVIMIPVTIWIYRYLYHRKSRY